MDIGTFHSDISAEIARGTANDARIPRWTRLAAKWLEQNYSFKYMEKHGVSALDPEAIAPNVLTLPNNRIKSVTLVQPYQTQADGRKAFSNPLSKADRRDVTSIDLGYPSGWWQVGNALHFDAKPTEGLFNLDLVWTEYTDWPTEAEALPVLLERYENLLFAQTMRDAWIGLKDMEAASTWQGLRDEALRVVLVAEDADVWEAQDDLRMNAETEVMPLGTRR